jgi:aspartate carbamoyltransferase regulatory subunit
VNCVTDYPIISKVPARVYGSELNDPELECQNMNRIAIKETKVRDNFKG